MLTTGVNQESETDQDHETGVELALGHPKDTLGIWLTHIFHQDAGESVEDEKEPRDRSMDQLGKANSNKVKNGKDERAFKKSFVKLGSVAGCNVIPQRLEDFRIFPGNLDHSMIQAMRDGTVSLDHQLLYLGVDHRRFIQGMLDVINVALFPQCRRKLHAIPGIGRRLGPVKFTVDKVGHAPKEHPRGATIAIPSPRAGQDSLCFQA